MVEKPKIITDRIHPSSMAELRSLVALHGARRIRQAIDEIERNINAH